MQKAGRQMVPCHQQTRCWLIPLTPRSTILRVCSLTQPGRTEALHFLVLSSECEDLRQYTSQPSDTQISQTMHIYVPVSNTQDSEIAILPFHATVCRGPGDIIYSTLTTMEDTFCNPTHDSVHDFMFYAFALYPGKDFTDLDLSTWFSTHLWKKK